MHLTLTPSGHLMMTGSVDAVPAHDESCADERIARSFAESQSAGIMALAGGRITGNWPLSWLYWRDFGVRYLMQLCLSQSAAERLDNHIKGTS